MSEQKFWASRMSGDYRDLLWSELEAGRLRQGWGKSPDQNLDVIAKLPKEDLSVEQTATARHHHMRGGKGGWQKGDIVLIPNMPHRRMFSLARIKSDYRYEPIRVEGAYFDFGHIRDVELLTPHGIANQSAHVNSGIRHSLTARGRTWQLRNRDKDFEKLLVELEKGNSDLTQESTKKERLEGVVEKARKAALDAIGASFKTNLDDAFGKAEWETVIAEALRTHLPDAEIIERGGAGEKGSDIDVIMPNLFDGTSWTVVIQVKDWKGSAGPSPVHQLRRAIEDRNKPDADGNITTHVVGAVVALTNAEPDEALELAMIALEEETGVSASVVQGKRLLELIMRGVIRVE